jgi:hypothetical protein
MGLSVTGARAERRPACAEAEANKREARQHVSQQGQQGQQEPVAAAAHTNQLLTADLCVGPARLCGAFVMPESATAR